MCNSYFADIPYELEGCARGQISLLIPPYSLQVLGDNVTGTVTSLSLHMKGYADFEALILILHMLQLPVVRGHCRCKEDENLTLLMRSDKV